MDSERSRPAKRTARPSEALDRSAKLEDRVFWLAALTAVASTVGLFQIPFLLGRLSFYHDSLTSATLMALFYDRMFSGDSLLWSALLNGGHPLWPSLEIFPVFDPVVVAVYPAAVALGAGWMTPYSVTAFVWLFVFALGGGLCAKRLTGDRWAALPAFVLLFAGPIALSVPAQSGGFLLPFRYFPLTIYLYLGLREEISPARVLFFNATIAFSLAGYQSVFPFIAYLSLVLAELAVGGRGYLAWLRKLSDPRTIWMFAIPLVALAPTFAWLDTARDLVPIPRAFAPFNVFFYSPVDFVRDLFMPYFDIVNLRFEPLVYHGISFLGFLSTPFLLVGLRRCAVDGIRSLRGGREESSPPRLSAVLVIWLVLTVALAGGVLGIREHVLSDTALLGVRNFGFLLIAAVFLLALMVARGFTEMFEGRYTPADIAIDTAVVAACLFVTEVMLADRSPGTWTLAALLGTFVLVALVFWRLSIRFGPVRFALTVAAAILAESLMFGSHLMPSWEQVATLRLPADDVGLVRDRMPRFGSARETLPNNRVFEFPAAETWPWHMEGPVVGRIASAVSDPVYLTPMGVVGQWLTHLFRLRPYHRLLAECPASPRLRDILGAGRPLLEVVPMSAIEGPADDLRLVLQDSPGQDSPGACRDPGPMVESSADGLDLPRGQAGEILDVDYDGDRVAVVLRATQDAALVYRDNFAPGWRASVDGRAADLLVVDRLNKAVFLPAGEHRVEFRYRPWGYLVGFALRAVLLAALAVACLALGARRLLAGRAGRA